MISSTFCYICNRTEDEVNELLDSYNDSTEINPDSIKKTKHHIIRRQFEKGESGLRCLMDDDKPQYNELPIRIEFPVCVICHTLVWHKFRGLNQ